MIVLIVVIVASPLGNVEGGDKVFDYMNDHSRWIPLFVQPVTYALSPRIDYKLIPADGPGFPHRITWQAGYPK